MPSKIKIAVILNANYHIETAISIYKSLLDNEYFPTLVIIHGQSLYFELLEYLKLYNINYTIGWDGTIYNKLFITSAFPTIQYQEIIPNIEHKIIKNHNKNDIILISHRINNPATEYKTIYITPRAKDFNLDFLYICENFYQNNHFFYKPIKFLIQGNIERRDLYLLDNFFNKIKLPNELYKIIIVSYKHQKFSKEHPSLIKLLGLSEINFYKLVSECDFILPLISKETYNQTYFNERFSTSFGLSWMLNKPIITDKEINTIYKCPAIEYSDSNSFIQKMAECILISNKEYNDLLINNNLYINKLKNHNKNILKNITT